jgi:hypothetical protein
MIIENFCRPVSWHMNRILALRKILRKANLIFTKVKKKMGPEWNSREILVIRGNRIGTRRLPGIGKNTSLQSWLTALEECSINSTRGRTSGRFSYKAAKMRIVICDYRHIPIRKWMRILPQLYLLYYVSEKKERNAWLGTTAYELIFSLPKPMSFRGSGSIRNKDQSFEQKKSERCPHSHSSFPLPTR